MAGVFRAYDIRGIYGSECNPPLFLNVGFTFGKFLKDKVYVGGDVRLSSPCLKSAFTSGVLASGYDCTDIGVIATPTLYFASTYYGSYGGAMITASHNPPEYNGIKLCRDGVTYSYETCFETLEREIKKRHIKFGNWEDLGSLDFKSVVEDYKDFILKRLKLEDTLRVVIDFGNGSCGFAAKLFEEGGYTVTELFQEPDGRFPNHIPDPLREDTLGDLKTSVIEEQADLGIAFDGDGDRVGFIDNKGRTIAGDDVFILLARDIIERNPGCKIIATPLTSKSVFEEIRKRGGELVLSRTGHSYVQEKLVGEEALLAGELSGHYYIGENYYGFDDGIFAALKFGELLSRSGRRLSELIDKIPHYASSSEVRIRCPDDHKFNVVESIKAYYRGEGYPILDIDGVRVEFEKGWGLVRASNTEPAIVLRFEADEEKDLVKIRRQIMKKVNKNIKEVC